MYSAKRRFRLFRSPAFTFSDKLIDSLSTSLTAYENASTDTWVKITSTEYTAINENVSGTTYVGTTPTVYSAIGTSTGMDSGEVIFSNVVGDNTPGIPENGYVFAIKFYFNGTNSTISVHANNDTASSTGFVKIGENLPTTTVGDNYYILKSPSTLYPTGGRIALWSDDNAKHGYKTNVSASGVSLGRFVAEPSPSTVLNNGLTLSSAASIQALATTVKQW